MLKSVLTVEHKAVVRTFDNLATMVAVRSAEPTAVAEAQHSWRKQYGRR